MSRVEPNRNVYVGHRYVPKIFGEWDKQNEYEGLSIVTHKGASYTSKKRVPVGIDILNEEFWVLTANYDAQVEYYRQETKRVSDDLETLDTKLDDEVEKMNKNISDTANSTKNYIDTETGKIVTAMGDLDDNLNNKIDNVNTKLGERIDSTNTKLDYVDSRTKVNEDYVHKLTREYDFTANSPQPPKQGLLTNNFKVVRKLDHDNLEIFQSTTKGYLRYLFTRGTGGSGVGMVYDLLRVVRVDPISDVVVFKHLDDPIEGKSPRTYNTGDQYFSSPIKRFMNFEYRNGEKDTNFHTPHPLTPHTIKAGESATFSVQKRMNGKLNVMFFYRKSHSGNGDTVNVYVNDQLARTVTIDSSFNQEVKRFDIPVTEAGSLSGEDSVLRIRLENKSTNEVYPVGLNVFKLNEVDKMNGSGYDSFLAVSSSLAPFISSNGASDYALKNAEDGKQFGSYHGGEESNRCDILFTPLNSDHTRYRGFDNIDDGEFSVTRFFTIKQIGILIQRAYMHSQMSFNTDGTLQMDFSYQVMPGKTPIPLIDFWTCLTCTDPNFSILRSPVYMSNKENSGHQYFKSTLGHVVQETPNGQQELHSRFTRFPNDFVGVREPSSISVQSMYHKHYYAPIREYRDSDNPIAPEVMQFSKGLDFNIY